MNLERLYFTVEQLADHWDTSIDDVMQFGLTSQLEFMAIADWEYPRAGIVYRGQHTTITYEELADIYYAKEPFSVTGEAGETGKGIFQGDQCIITYYPGLSRLIIQAEEVKKIGINHDGLTPDYLINDHPTHSSELAIAIEAWKAVLQNNPKKPKTGSRKTLIIDWLKKNHPKLNNSEIKRITTMINPDKTGGAPKTE